jgi:hypothetical protein
LRQEQAHRLMLSPFKSTIVPKFEKVWTLYPDFGLHVGIFILRTFPSHAVSFIYKPRLRWSDAAFLSLRKVRLQAPSSRDPPAPRAEMLNAQTQNCKGNSGQSKKGFCSPFRAIDDAYIWILPLVICGFETVRWKLQIWGAPMQTAGFDFPCQ